MVEAPTRFNVASVRKSYIGFAIALAVHQQKIASIDDEIADYLVDLDTDIVRGTTIRHLLTHTHGLLNHQQRRFPAGTGWHYNNVGIKMLNRLIQQVFDMSLAQVMMHHVFRPCHLMETGWTMDRDEHLVWLGEEYTSESGDQANLFVSARDLAFWGYLHLNKGFIQGKQIIPRDIFE
ncbi:serine hydrolase domain-containing protein [Paenibacillus sp. ISL-20]|uniref:serine hydrolase domain-containing protein n=1 Tax=Paenibacillus sp. ISL-20 TaxID=2819163 RepID=UPI001BE66CD1|nr:beta-lactamase family protein [Paenibacillus sp. ISL-20]